MKNCKPVYKGKKYDNLEDLNRSIFALSAENNASDLQKFNQTIANEVLNDVSENSLNFNITYKSIHIDNMVSDLFQKGIKRKELFTEIDKDFYNKFKNDYIRSIRNSREYKNRKRFINYFNKIKRLVNFEEDLDVLLEKHEGLKHLRHYYAQYQKTNSTKFLDYMANEFENFDQNIEILEENFEELFNVAFNKLKSYNFVTISKNDEGDIDMSNDEEMALNIRNVFEDEISFRIDSRDKLTAEIKLAFLNVDYAVDYSYNPDTKEYETVPSIFMGRKRKMSFDFLYNEMSAILAFGAGSFDLYKSKVNKEDLFNEYVEMLKSHIDKRPYFINVIETLEKFTKQQRLGFITNMSKSAINHNSTFNITVTSNINGIEDTQNSLINKKTNAVQSVKVLTQNWERNILNSDLTEVRTEDGTLVFNEEKVKEFEEELKTIYSKVEGHYSEEKKKLMKTKFWRTSSSVKEKRQMLKDIKELEPETIKKYQKLFNKIGIDISADALNYLYKSNYNAKGAIIELETLPTEKNSIFNVFLRNIKDKNGDLIEINIDSNNIYNDGLVQEFAKFLTRFENTAISLNYSDSKGKAFYGISLNKFLTDRTRDLKTDLSLLENLTINPFSQDSYMLDYLYNKDKKDFVGGKFENHFDYFLHSTDSVKQGNNFNPKYLRYSSKFSYDKVAVGYFSNKKVGRSKDLDDYHKFSVFGKEVKMPKWNAKYFLPPSSDKHLVYGLNAFAFEITDLKNGKLKADSKVIDLVIKEAFLPEYKRIRKAQKEYYEAINDAHQAGSNIFYFIPELNDTKHKFLYDGEGKLKDIEDNADAQSKLRKVIRENLEKKFEKTLEDFKDSEIADKNGKIIFKDKDFNIGKQDNKFIYEFAINYFINNVNYYKLFANDPAQYYKGDTQGDLKVKKESTLEEYNAIIKKTVDNQNKRLAGVIAPGTDIIAESADEKTNFLVLEDIEDYPDDYFNFKGIKKSLFQDYFKELLGKDSYDNMKGTDGMGYMSMQEFLDIERKRGHISDEEAKTILKFEKEFELNPPSLKRYKAILKKTLLNSMKPVYYNSYWNGNEMETLYVKYSSMPLAKHLTRQIPTLNDLRNFMNENDVKNAVYNTAVKTGSAKQALKIYDKNGEIRKDITQEEIGLAFKRMVPRQGHKIQQDLPNNKSEVIDASQHKKLLFADILDVKGIKEIKEKMMSDYDRLFSIKLQNFKDKISFNEETGNFDKKKLRDVLVKEIEDRGYPPSALSFIGLNEDGNFNVPLWGSNFSNKIESVLLGLVSNQLFTHKTRGFNPILASSVGFNFNKLLKGDDAQKFMKKLGSGLNSDGKILFDEAWAKDETNPNGILRPQRIDKKTGKVLPAEVLIANNYYYTNNKGKKVKLNLSKFVTKDGFLDTKQIPEQLLTSFGYRIPTQSLSSMSYIKVVGILPDTYSDMIIAPSEFTIQMGSDFDIDKLFFNIFNFNYKDDKITFNDLDEIQQLENNILQSKLDVVSNPSEKIQRKITSPLDDNMFKSIVDTLEKLNPENDSLFSYNANRDKYFRSISGNSAIGVFANASTLHAILQGDTNYRLVNDKGTPIPIKLGWEQTKTNEERSSTLLGNSLNDTKIIGKDYTKADALSDLITLGVDNETLLYLEKLNINKDTYSFVIGMIMNGYSAELTTYMINQPIIKDYIKLNAKVKDGSVSNYKKEQLAKQLHQKYGGFGIFDAKRESNENDKKSTYLSTLFVNVTYGENKDENDQGAILDFHLRFTEQDLQNNINTYNTVTDLTEDYYSQQAAILYSFLNYTNKFSRITKLQEALNIDGTNKVGNSLAYSMEKQRQMQDVIDETIGISNSAKILFDDMQEIPKEVNEIGNINSIIPNGYYIINETNDNYEIAKPKNIQGILFNNLKFVNRLYNKPDMFIYNSDLFQQFDTFFRDNFYKDNDNSRLNTKQREEFSKQSFTEFRKYLNTEFYTGLFNKSIEEERLRLFTSEKDRPSFVKILNHIKYNTDLFKNNFLLSSLQIIDDNKLKAGNIEYDVKDKQNESLFVNSEYQTLLNDNTIYYNENGISYTGRDIALDLVRFLTLKGNFNSRKNFLSLIDFKTFDIIGFTDRIKQFNPYNNDFTGQINNFLVQYAQHNMNKKEVKDYLSKYSYETITEIDGKDEYLVSDKNNNYPIVFMKDKMLLYRVSQTDENAFYRRIFAAGDEAQGISEYNFELAYIDKSIVPFNDINVQESERRRNFNIDELNRMMSYKYYYEVVNPKDESKSYFQNNSTEKAFKLRQQELKEFNEQENESLYIKLISYTDEKGVTNVYQNPRLYRDKESGIAFIDTNIDTKNKVEIKTEDDSIQLHTNLDDREKARLKARENAEEVRKKEKEEEEKRKQKEYEEKINAENQAKTFKEGEIQKFKDIFNVSGEDGKAQEDIENMLKTIMNNEKLDAYSDYVYTLLKDNLDNVFENNNNIKLNFIYNKNSKFTARVNTENSEIKSLTINVAKFGKVENYYYDGKNSEAFSQVLIEEILHLYTRNAAANDSTILNEINNIMVDYVNSLPKDTREKIIKLRNKVFAYSQVVSAMDKHPSNYKEQLNFLREALTTDPFKKNKEAEAKITELYNKLKNEKSFNLEKEFYKIFGLEEGVFYENKAEEDLYPFINTDEFVAKIFRDKDLQKKLNETTYRQTKKKTLYDRFMDLLIRILNKLSRKSDKILFYDELKKDSMLKEAVTKTMTLVKGSKYDEKTETNIRKNSDKETDIVEKYKHISATDLKETLALEIKDPDNKGMKLLLPISNTNKVYKRIKELFPNINLIEYKDDYIIVMTKGQFKDYNEMRKEDKEIYLYNTYNLKSKPNKNKDKKAPKIVENTLLDKDNKKLQTGSLVTYKGKEYIFVESKPNYYLISKYDSSRISLTKKDLENLQVKGNYSTVKYNNKTYIVTDNSLIEFNKGKSPINMPLQDSKGVIIQANKELHDEIINFKKGGQTTLFSLTGTIDEVNTKRKNRLKVLRANRIRSLKRIRDIARSTKDDKKYRLVNDLIDDLENNVEKIDDLNTLDDLANIARQDLEEVKKILDSPTYNDSDTVYIDKVISNWLDVYNLYFTDKEYEKFEKTVDAFGLIINNANKLKERMHNKNEKFFQDSVNKRFDKNINLKEYFDDFEDITSFDKYGYDISRFNNPFLSYIHTKNTEAFNETKRETFDRLKKATNLIDDILPVLSPYSNKENGIFNIFFQKYNDGTLTGDMVSPFSKSFQQEKEEKLSNLIYAKDKEKASKLFNKWLKSNTVYFNPSLLLFDNLDKRSQKEKDKHVKQLKAILGDKLFDYFYEKQKGYIAKYKQERIEKLKSLLIEAELDSKNDTAEDLKKHKPLIYNEFVEWQAENSPFIHYNTVNEKYYEGNKIKLLNKDGNVVKSKVVFNQGYKYLVNIPKTRGSNYDENFRIILENDKLLEFYKEYRNILEELSIFLPSEVSRKIAFNGLPDIKKTFLEALKQEGLVNSGKFLYNSFIEEITTAEQDVVSNKDINTVTGQEGQALKFNLIRTNRNKDFDEFKNMKVKEALANNENVSTFAFRKKVEKEYNNNVAKMRSKDLGKMLKAYVGLALTYKHKSRIQDTLLAGEIFINNLEERERTNTKEKSVTRFLDAKVKPNNVSYANLKEVYKHYLRSFFDAPYAKEGVLNKKLKTTADRKKIDKYNQLKLDIQTRLDSLDDLFQNGDITLIERNKEEKLLRKELESIDEKIKNVGDNLTLSKVGDSILKYNQLKGMGWNILAGIGNLGFGYTSLLSEAADGRVLTRDEILDAMKLSMNSVARNLSFHKYGGKNDIAIKIRNLMDRNDVLKEASHELYSNSVKGTFAKRLRFLHPYNMQKRTEYLVQTPIMIAFYKKRTFNHNGKEIPLWKAYNNEGAWNTKEFGKEPTKLLNEVNAEITQMIKRIHGNYDPTSPMLVKHKVLGRALVQFRTWLFEGYSRRWGKYDMDEILKTDYEGFYRVLPKYKMQSDKGYFGVLIDIMKAVTFNMVSYKTSFESPETSALVEANMRKLVEEITMYLRMIALYYLFSFMFEDDEENSNFVLNNTLNTINNVNGELELYFNPMKLKGLATNPIPALSIVSDLYRIHDSTLKTIQGEPVIENGLYAGENRLMRSLKKAIPFLTMGEKINAGGKSIFNEAGMN